MTLQGDSLEAARYGEARNLTSLPGDRILREARRLLADPSWRVRRAVWESLLRAELDASTVCPFLLDCLDDDNTGVRTAATEALIHLGSDAIPHILKGLYGRPVRSRKALLDLLAKIGDHRAQPAALQLLQEDPDENVRFAAAEVLGVVGDADAAQAMLRGLGAAEGSDRFALLSALASIVRRTGFSVDLQLIARDLSDDLCGIPAASLLADAGGADAGPLLWDFLSKRQADGAIEALVTYLRRSPDFRPAQPDEVIDRLITRASTAHAPTLRRNIFELVALLAPVRLPALTSTLLDGNVPWLVEALSEQPAPVLRAVVNGLLEAAEGRDFVAQLLGLRPDLEGEPTLLAMLSQVGSHQPAVVRALGRIGTIRSVPHLLSLCSTGDRELADEAAAGLLDMARRGLPEMGRLLAASVQQTNIEGLLYLLPVLGHLDDEASAEVIAASMRHAEAAVRRTAVLSALSGAPHPEVERLLIIRLADEDDEVRAAAASACGDAGLVTAREKLPILLEDPNPWCQATALRALSKLDAPPPAQQLMELLRRGGVVSSAAATMVAEHDYADCFEALEAILPELEDDSIAELVKALATYRRELSEATLRQLLAHQAWNVRLAAASYIGIQKKDWMLMLIREFLDTETDGLVRLALEELVV